MTQSDPSKRPSPSIFGPLAGLCGTLAILAGIGLAGRGGSKEIEPVSQALAPATVVVKAVAPAVAPVVTPEPTPPPKIEPDRAVIARAEESLDAATRSRAESEARLADAGLALRKAALDSAGAAAAGRSLAYQVKDPTARIERATNRVAMTRWEIKKLQGELAALDRTPRPKAKALMDKSAVAKPIDGREYHFEVRRDRVSFLDIDKFTDLVKTDVRLRLRISGGRNRSLTGVVGPVGDFSMRYVMGLTMPESMEDMLDMRGVTTQLRGWELVPESDVRGETYETLASPASAYGRVIRRISPSSATITLWIYPDGYPLYRRLRDDLHARGFLVAARPLPEGMTIRGSPGGSLSAGQ